ncbi:MAG: hypothetical protein M1476_00050 [Candidatus Thermoplasmatota archaeon]|nr:hypothetical protein [Candidatus Thermoplasmatota archaeon]
MSTFLLLKNRKTNNRTSVNDALLRLLRIYPADVGDLAIMTEIPGTGAVP